MAVAPGQEVTGMCDSQGAPANVSEALGMLHQALDHLTAADAASLPSAVQAEALRSLERAGAKHTAARSQVVAAFAGQAAYHDDGQGSVRAWLRWHTRITTGAAAGAIGWARRLSDHSVIAAALAAADLSESWARQVCAWTDRLPPAHQDEADEILVAAARAGVDLAGLAGLAQEMYECSWRDRDDGPGDGFGERGVTLGTTLGGAGRLSGDLTAGCSAALTAVLDALGKRAGPEDIRSAAQRRHDALEEACKRLIATGMLPGRAAQPTQIILHMSLSQLRDLPGASAAEAAWAAARATQPGWVYGPEADAAACDASVVPIVTGHLDPAALDHLTDIFLATRHPGRATSRPSGTATGVHATAEHPDGTTSRPGGIAGHSGGPAGHPSDIAAHPGGIAGHPRGPAGHPGGTSGDTVARRGCVAGQPGAGPPAADAASGIAGHPRGPAGHPGGTSGDTVARRGCVAGQPGAGPPAADAASGGNGLAGQAGPPARTDGCGGRTGGAAAGAPRTPGGAGNIGGVGQAGCGGKIGGVAGADQDVGQAAQRGAVAGQPARAGSADGSPGGAVARPGSAAGQPPQIGPAAGQAAQAGSADGSPSRTLDRRADGTTGPPPGTPGPTATRTGGTGGAQPGRGSRWVRVPVRWV